MKTSYLILFFILFSTFLKAQTVRVDYDNSSKWFMGFNVGGTWNTTDIQNRTSVGWGLILGKSYGYKTYSPLTFDIRARYLRGFWYGQDNDTSSLSGYTGTALNGYSSQGFTVHNFQSDVHRLGLELAVHLNSVTARNGWDPYIFGGIGFTWHQTFGDLENQNDTSAVYDYSSMLNSGSLEDQLNANLDEIYDSPLDGFSKNSYNVAFMPSLGFGLGYHIGKRTTLGVEHKTTFTLRDDFDGLTSNVRAKNDLYHYTSLYLRFRFRGKKPNNVVTNTPCISPVISLNNSAQNQTVTNPQYTIQATVSEVRSSNQISVTSNTGISIPFDYDFNSKTLTANVLLVPGVNSYTIRVSNRCGSDSKVVSVNFLNCSLPTAVFTNPSVSNSTVRTQAYTLTASINGVNSTQGINLMHNGTIVNGYSFNATNGLLQASITLVPGLNNFSIELFNACGNNSVLSSVSYDNCVTPSISMVNPSATGTTVNTSAYAISAIVNGITDKNLISITQNNVAISNFVYLNGKIDLSTNLIAGINTFTISGSNNCGNFSETFTVNYQTCNAPIINLEYPTITGTNLTNSTLSLKAKVLNVETRQNIAVSVNGLAIKNVTFNKSTNSIDVPITLGTIGNNTITVTATNSCGVDVETSTVVYAPCTAPSIGLSAMASTVNLSAYNFTANITNQTSTEGITLTLNGNPINYSFSNNSISASVNLQNGQNTFVLTAVNACGRDTKTWNVTNNNCVTPSIILENPTATGITVNNNSIQFKATINGMNSNQGISLLLNNTPVAVVYQNGIISNTLNLLNGANTIKLSIQNACGADNEELIINYQTCDAPLITINQPIDNNFTVTQSNIQINATVANLSSNQGITLKLNGIGIPFQMNGNQITSSVNLQPGANTILFSATNSCGTDVKALTINYNNCVEPQIQITNSQSSTSNSNLTLNALVSGTNVTAGLTVSHNGTITAYNLTGNNLSANISLTPGVNLITLSAVNSCGSNSQSYSVNYSPCLSPTVVITNPASSNLTVNSGSFTFQAESTNINSSTEISMTVNGVNFTNFTFANGQILANLNLTTGQNTIKITTTTSCGTDTKTITINGKSCDSPLITLNSSNNSESSTPMYNLQATVVNVSSNQGISLSVNGTSVSNFSFNNGLISSNINLTNGTNTIAILASNECGNSNQVTAITYNPIVEEEKITICHIPPGNPNNPQTIEIPLSAWPAHQAHGDVMGTCVPVEEKITICHIPPGNPNNPQTIEIPLSAWPAHQAHGDVMGACPENNNSNGSNNNGNSGGSNNNNSNNSNQEEQKITICHIPPGNPNNPQTIEIPLSAWPAHQAHGDVMGACLENNNSNGSNNNGNSGGSNNNNSNNSNQEEQKITICHIPPGNPNNPQTIEIPLSAWPAHQAHGDVMGACPENNNSNGSNNNGNSGGSNNQGNGNSNGSNNNQGETNSNENNSSTSQTITICHKHQGRMGNDETMTITVEEWPEHEAHGDFIGTCSNNEPIEGNSNNNNNGSGNTNPETNGNQNNSENNNNSNGNNGSSGNGNPETNGNQNNSENNNNSNGNNGGSGNGNPETNGNQNNSENNNNSNGNNGGSGNGNPETNGNNNEENGGSGNNGSGNGKRSQQAEGNNSNRPTVNPNGNKTGTNKPNSNTNQNNNNPVNGNKSNTNKPNSNTNQNNNNSGGGNNTKNNTNKPNPNVNKPNTGNQNNPNNKPNPENKEPDDKKPETPKIKKG